MQSELLLTVFVVIIGLAFAAQAVVLYFIYRSVLRVQGDVEKARAEVHERVAPVAQAAAELLNGSRASVERLTSNLADLSQLLRERVGRIDALLEEVTDKGRQQIIRVDQLIANIVEKVETTTTVVQRNVLAPIQEASALVKGVRSGLEFLFARRPARGVGAPGEGQPDEQLFI